MGYCVCGHSEFYHGIYSYGISACWKCPIKTGRHEHKFQLDNLSYIEQLAKKRKLI